MFFLRTHAAAVRRRENGAVGVPTLLVASPAIAGAAQRPLGSFLGSPFRLGHGRLRVRGPVTRLMSGFGGCATGHAMVTDEMTLFQPEAIDVADALTEVLPGY